MTQRFVRGPSVQMERPCLPGVWCMLLLALTWAISSPSLAAAGQNLPRPVWERTEEPFQAAVVKTKANLRASPSLEGNVLSLAREGTVVQILEGTRRWYRIKTTEGMEAWIYKTLLVIPRVSLGPQPGGADDAVPPTPEPPIGGSAEMHPLPPSEQPASLASPPVEGEHHAGMAISQPVPTPEQATLVHQPPERPQNDHTLADAQRLSGYLLLVLFLGLLVVMGLQLRTARQLRRAMRQVDQITRHPAPTPQSLGAVEKIQAVAPLAAAGLGQPSTAHFEAEVPPLLDLPEEMSALERTVIEAMYEQGELQERELVNILEKRGFPGVLIKAVIGDLVRKTGSDGPPWVRVRHAHGRYTYQFQGHNLVAHADGRQRG